MMPMVGMRQIGTRFVVICLMFLPYTNAITKCDKTSLCSCETENGLIDFHLFHKTHRKLIFSCSFMRVARTLEGGWGSTLFCLKGSS